MYGEEFEEQEEETVIGSLGEHDSKKEKKTGRKASEQGHGSPLKRKESFARRDKWVSRTEITLFVAYV